MVFKADGEKCNSVLIRPFIAFQYIWPLTDLQTFVKLWLILWAVSQAPALQRLQRDPGVILGLSYRSRDLQPVKRFVKGIVINTTVTLFWGGQERSVPQPSDQWRSSSWYCSTIQRTVIPLIPVRSMTAAENFKIGKWEIIFYDCLPVIKRLYCFLKNQQTFSLSLT